ILEANGARDARLQVLRWWSHHLEAQLIHYIGRAIDVVGGVDFKCEVVQTRRVASVQREHVMVRTFGAQKNVLTMLFDWFEAPAVGIKLSLTSEVAGVEA